MGLDVGIAELVRSWVAVGAGDPDSGTRLWLCDCEGVEPCVGVEETGEPALGICEDVVACDAVSDDSCEGVPVCVGLSAWDTDCVLVGVCVDVEVLDCVEDEV